MKLNAIIGIYIKYIYFKFFSKRMMNAKDHQSICYLREGVKATIMCKKTILLCSLIFSLTLLIPQSIMAQKILNKGDQAPDFSTEASLDGKAFEFSLKDALAKGPVVLYFYPSAYTPGCDLEAHTFSELSGDFKAAHTTIIGLSADNIERLNDFSADPDFCAGNFPVGADEKGTIAATYGLQISGAKEGAKDVRGVNIDHGFLPRVTFVIGKDGTIIEMFSSEEHGLSPDEHVTKSLAIVQNL